MAAKNSAATTSQRLSATKPTTLSRSPSFPWLLVAFVTGLVFASSLQNGFVNWDDGENFISNIYYRGLSPANLRWMFTTFHTGVYVPLAWMSLGMDYVLWGMNPAGYHLTSLLLHIASALWVYAIADRLLKTGSQGGERSWIPAVCAALFFAIHPLRVESVAWITERRDVLSGFFLLASLWFYLNQQRKSSLFSFLLALLSKGTVVLLPFWLLIIDFYQDCAFGMEFNWRKRLFDKTLYFLLALPFVALAFYGQHLADALAPPHLWTFSDRFSLTFYAVLFYTRKTVWPVDLSPFYEIPFTQLSSIWKTTLIALIWLLGTIFLYMIRKKHPGLWAAWIWFLVGILPVSGLFESGSQLAADRYSYLPCLSAALLVGGGIRYLCRLRHEAQSIGLGLALLLFIALGGLTLKQTRIWHDGFSLWNHALEVDPTSAQAHYAIAGAYLERHDTEKAIKHLRQALHSPFTALSAHNNLGATLAAQGRLQEAVTHFQFVLDRTPNDGNARRNLEKAKALLAK